MNMTEDQKVEYELRCARIGLDPHPEEVPLRVRRTGLLGGGGTRSLMRLAILVEIISGRNYHFDPIMAADGDYTQPVPAWLINSRGGNI